MVSEEFQVDNDVVHIFMNAPSVTIAEALASPTKRRLSICGNVDSVSVC